MGSLKITVADGTHGPVVELSGEADFLTAPELAAALTAQIDTGPRLLTVQLSGLSFADTATFHAFLVADRALRAKGGTLLLISPRPAVARALRLLGIDKVISVLPNQLLRT